MSEIQHKTALLNGIQLHIAESGPSDGPIVLFVHGFPELWYSWRHQIAALSAHGFRAVAPDLRGYGDSDKPESFSSYTYLQVIGDLVALIDWLGAEKVFVVGHDWGALIAWYLCLLRPDRVKALVNLSVAFLPRNPKFKPLAAMKALYGDDYYIVRFQEPGEIEARIAEVGTEHFIKFILTYRKPEPIILPKGSEFGNGPIPLPPWLSEDDVEFYIRKYEQTGFTAPINYYRALDLGWELTAPWTKSQVKVPVKFMVGDLDLTYNSYGAKEYIHGGGFKRDVPLLEEVVVMKNVGHFIHEEKPDEVNKHIIDFLQKY
ncbi:Alpha/beta hydrolase fold-1 [Dillenia turbinata]|uniref:soluble epoxide hydrolase n=1 Tax=Dillenia turbinata TaxID=194707 RepID=A0AAN8UL01_9MAGN